MPKSSTRCLLFLVVSVLVLVAAPSWADQFYVVVYVEVQPAQAQHGAHVLDDLAAVAQASGAIDFNVLRQIDRNNFFALFEIWSSEDAYQAFKTSAASVLSALQPLLGAPLDERPGTLIK